MVFLFSVLLLTAFSISQQQICPPDNVEDKTICARDNMGWRSNISKAKGSGYTGRTFKIMWDRNLNFSMTAPGGYMVVCRELESGNTQTLTPTNMNEGFKILNLRPDSRYVAMVCLPRTAPPSNFELSPVCGNCRLCFRTIREVTAPSIVKATVAKIPRNVGLIYICEVVGNPLPNITWSAVHPNGSQQELQNTSEITITTNVMNAVMMAQLTISLTIGLEQPMCTADNGIGKASEDMFTMEFPISFFKNEPSVPVSYIISIVIPVTVAVSLLFGVSLCLCYIRYYKRKVKRNHRNLNTPTVEVDVAETSLMKREQSLLHNLPKSLIISRNEIQVSTVIGQGEFGIIYKGYLNSNTMDTVAIKTLKGIFATTNDIESMSKEIEKMQHFEHPNVMSLIGVCKAPSGQGNSSGGPCIVMPFMIKGSLLDQLRNESDEFNVTSEEDKKFENVKKVLLQMCLQIAKGMEYLASQKFVHRDLAARNCLVDANGIIKVSDFGLAEDIYCQNYFHQVQGSTKLPLKWMAIESITQGKFTEKSDVWSYGITCWEVFTGGSMPYPGMHPREVLDFLQNGERSARPKNAACDSNMYDLMQSCWESKDNSRPSFSHIVTYLIRNLEYTSDYLDLNGLKNGTPTIKLIANCSVHDPKPVYDSILNIDSLSYTLSIANDYYLADN